MAKYPIVNGFCFGASSAEVKLKGKTYLGIGAINFSDELQKEDADGSGSVAVGVVVGKYIASVDFEMLKHESDTFLDALGNAYGMVPFNIFVSYVEQPGAGTSFVEITAATVMKLDGGHQKGSSAVVDKYTLKVTVPIKRNGKTIVDTARGGADVAVRAVLA